MNAAVFLDRDNTIIHNDGDLGDPSKVQLIQGAASAIASLRGLGYLIVIVTNQGGVARGKYGVEDVDKVHEKIAQLIYDNARAKVDRFYFCPYHPQGSVQRYTREHPWRKPQPGMLLQAAQDLNIDMEHSWMIGDALRDIEAGAAAGVRTILLEPNVQTLPPLTASAHGAGDENVHPDFVAATIIEATRVIAQQRRPDRIATEWETPGEKVNKQLQPARSGKMPLSTSKPATNKPFRPWNAPSTENVSVEPGMEQGEIPSSKLDETSVPVSDVAPKTQPPVVAVAPPEVPLEAPPVATPVAVEKEEKVIDPVEPLDPKPVEPKPVDPKPTLPAHESELDAPLVRLPDPVKVQKSEDPLPNGDANAEAESNETLRFDGGATRLLRQIHQELKNQRTHKGEFSWLRMFAAMMQMTAIVCMFISVWLGAGSNSFETFMYMMEVAIFTQLATIAMLMFDRH
ncbi:MAG: HAD-IIIA family hydrolase [Phycisphaeraceae bacterium]|nr:HAD-IIIA family hydrolase [Phycisphaeraceae bacterium]